MSFYYKQISRCLFSNQNYCILVSAYKWSIVCFRLTMRVIGPLMLLLANGLILSVLYIFLTSLLYQLSGDSLALYFSHLGLGMYLFVNIIFNYISCAFTPPGSPEKCDDPGKYFGQISSVIDGRTIYQIRNRLDLAPAVSYRYCRQCGVIKPPRSHHCSITGQCILHMDHYCPWMSNCVGYDNYRYFVLFLFWLFLGSIYVISITIGPLLEIPTDASGKISETDSTENAQIFYVFILALSACLAVGILLVWHVYLTLTNQTTIEFYINIYEKQDAKSEGMIFKNPYDMGWRKNLRRVFGDVPWYSALGISKRKPIQPEYPFLPDEIIENNFSNDNNDHNEFNNSRIINNNEYRKYGVISRV